MEIIIPFVHSYLDDVLSAGIVLGFTLAVQQQLTYRNRHYVFTIWHTVFFVFWFGLLFEVLFPINDSRHYSDPIDILAYALGGLFFHVYGNKPTRKLIFKKNKEEEQLN